MMRFASLIVIVSAAVLFAAAVSVSPAGARPLGDVEGAMPSAHRDTICTHIEAAAAGSGLPVAYLTRLIWRESRFKANAVSPKGAQGIAQFMPSTAAERGLADPFEPRSAIHAAASFLTDLKNQFGNLGLAAAAYNGGPNRVANWVAGSGGLPFETQHFVRAITGRTAFDWKEPPEGPGSEPDQISKPATCGAVVATLGRPARFVPAISPAPTAPWGAQVAGHFSKDRALAIYANLLGRYDEILAGRAPMVVGTRNRSRGSAVFFAVRIPAQSREEASAVCTKLKKAGAGCIVQKS
jgi:transglycosylase-like protein with SLT domain/sporulation related protein